MKGFIRHFLFLFVESRSFMTISWCHVPTQIKLHLQAVWGNVAFKTNSLLYLILILYHILTTLCLIEPKNTKVHCLSSSFNRHSNHYKTRFFQTRHKLNKNFNNHQLSKKSWIHRVRCENKLVPQAIFPAANDLTVNWDSLLASTVKK